MMLLLSSKTRKSDLSSDQFRFYRLRQQCQEVCRKTAEVFVNTQMTCADFLHSVQATFAMQYRVENIFTCSQNILMVN
jgi:hypothetical protein